MKNVGYLYETEKQYRGRNRARLTKNEEYSQALTI